MLPSSLVNFASSVEKNIQETLDPSKRGYQSNNKYKRTRFKKNAFSHRTNCCIWGK